MENTSVLFNPMSHSKRIYKRRRTISNWIYQRRTNGTYSNTITKIDIVLFSNIYMSLFDLFIFQYLYEKKKKLFKNLYFKQSSLQSCLSTGVPKLAAINLYKKKKEIIKHLYVNTATRKPIFFGFVHLITCTKLQFVRFALPIKEKKRKEKRKKTKKRKKRKEKRKKTKKEKEKKKQENKKRKRKKKKKKRKRKRKKNKEKK